MTMLTLDAEALYQELRASVGALVRPETQLLGVWSGGAWLAERLQADLGRPGRAGVISSALHRDDFGERGLSASTDATRLPYAVDGAHLLLLDDVLYTGRTIRAVLNELFDLARITGDLARQAAGRGIVFFRAGAAPWHDDVDVYRRAAACLPGARVFQSLDIWDLCALIASSAAFAGSSLHGRIVADAFGVPVLEGIVPTGEKVAAWRETWAGRDAAAVFRTAFGAWQTRMR